MDFREIQTNSGIVFLAEDFTFAKHYENDDGTRVVRCTYYHKKKSKCSVRGVVENGKFSYREGLSRDDHNHSPPSLVTLELRAALRSAAASLEKMHLTPGQLTQQVREEVLENLSDGCEIRRMELLAELPSVRTMRKVASNVRTALKPAEPKTRQEINFDQFPALVKTSEGQSIIVGDSGSSDPDRVLLFATNEQLRLLATSRNFYVDGTFAVVPSLFHQLVSIHCIADRHKYFPLAFALLPKKDSETYKKTFDLLKAALTSRGLRTPDDAMNTFLSDFEPGLTLAMRESFPHTRQMGCFFHYAQCIWREVQRRGWRDPYGNDGEFCLRVKMIIAMGTVPEHAKVWVLSQAQSFLRQDSRISVFLDGYFIPHWMNRVHFSMWTWFNMEVRTNNHVEGWHSFLKTGICTHPRFLDFVTHLVGMANIIRTDIQDHKLGADGGETNKVYGAICRKMLNLCALFYSLEPTEYLRRMAYLAPKPIGSSGLPGR